MLKRMLVAVLVMAAAMASVSVLADGEYYEIGSNPMDASRVPNPATDAIVKLASDSPVVSMIGGGGAVATGKRLRAGELVVIDKATRVAKWVARCGNEIVAPKGWIPEGPVMDLSGGPAQQATQAVAGPAPQAQNQQPVQVDVNVHQDQQTPQPTYVQEAQPGFWDMVGMSFAQAFAQGLGEGLAYRMVWGGGYGGYGYGGFAPVVYYPSPAYYGGGGGGDVFVNKYVTKTIYVNSFNSTSTWINNPGGPRGGGGGPVDPPADPGSGSGGTGGGTGTGGGPVDPGSNLRAQRNNVGRGEGSGSRKPLTEAQIARDFRGQSGSSVKPHGPTVGNDAYRPSARGGERYQQPSGNIQQRGGRQIMPPQRQSPSQMAPRQNTPRYAPPSYRGGWQTAPPRYSAPPRFFSAPVFRGGGEYTRPFAPVFRGGGGYSRPSAPVFRGGGYSRPFAPVFRGGGYSRPSVPVFRGGRR